MSPKPLHPKNLPKNDEVLIFLQILYFIYKHLAALYFDRYKMAQALLGRRCFKSFNIIKKAYNRVVLLSRIGWLNFSD